MSINLVKIEKKVTELIGKLNKDELNYLIDYLVEYKEGNIMLKTLDRIKQALTLSQR